MKIEFPGQYHNFRKTTIGDNIVSFFVDRSQSQQIKELVTEEIGTEYMITLVPTSANNSTQDGDPKELTQRFMNKLHGLLGEYAQKEGLRNVEEAKRKLKEHLIETRMINKSTKELDIRGLAKSCRIVEEWINQ